MVKDKVIFLKATEKKIYFLQKPSTLNLDDLSDILNCDKPNIKIVRGQLRSPRIVIAYDVENEAYKKDIASFSLSTGGTFYGDCLILKQSTNNSLTFFPMSSQAAIATLMQLVIPGYMAFDESTEYTPPKLVINEYPNLRIKGNVAIAQVINGIIYYIYPDFITKESFELQNELREEIKDGVKDCRSILEGDIDVIFIFRSQRKVDIFSMPHQSNELLKDRLINMGIGACIPS